MTQRESLAVEQSEAMPSMSREAFVSFAEQMEVQDRHFELIDTFPTEKPVTSRAHGQVIFKLSFYLQSYFSTAAAVLPNAWAGPEVTSALPHDERNVRQPDLSIFLNEPIEDSAASVMPDIAVEVKSRSNTYRALREKAHYYLANCTRIVWLFYPEKRQIEVITPDEEFLLLNEGDTLTADDVLPGFAVAVRDLFPPHAQRTVQFSDT